MKTYSFARLLIISLILIVFTALAATYPTRALSSASLTLNTPSIAEGNDFSTQVLGLPWNMSEDPYPGISTIFKKDVNKNTFVVSDGKWRFTSNGDHHPVVWMLWTGIENTQDILRIGDRFPINTNKYKLISINLCSDRTEKGIFYWYYTKAPHQPTDPEKVAWSDFFTISPGCQVYTFDMDSFLIRQGDWAQTSEGFPNGLRFNPQILTSTNATFELDWFRVTTIDPNISAQLQWTAVTPGSTLHFYASRTGCGIDGIPIGTQTANQANGTFNWGSSLQYFAPGRPYPTPEALEPDFYTLYMLENDTGAPICATAPLEIRPAPVLNFQKPSYFSGPEYSLIEKGDAWGMSNNADILDTSGFASYNLQGGIFNGTSNSNRLWLLLNDNSPNIDTSKYKYVTYRMFVEGFQTLSGGWLARFFWWNQGPGIDPSGTRGQVVAEGWHTYSLDMTTALMLDDNTVDWEGSPNGFRFDPIEPQFPPYQEKIHIDFLIITGDEIIQAGDLFPIYYDVTSDHETTVTLYYDTDKNPNNGRTAVTLYTIPPPAGDRFSFLPAISGSLSSGPEVDLLTGTRSIWDTNGVSPGAYYISGVISDGLNSTTWYSDIPVIIQ